MIIDRTRKEATVRQLKCIIFFVVVSRLSASDDPRFESQILYSRRSYRLGVKSSLGIIIYLYRVIIPRKLTKPVPLRRSGLSLSLFTILFSFFGYLFLRFYHGGHARTCVCMYLPFLSNKRITYPARIICSNRFINMYVHIYHTSLLRTGTQKSNLVSCMCVSRVLYSSLLLHLCPPFRIYVVTFVAD